jgi:threonine 3-dehydrogenase
MYVDGVRKHAYEAFARADTRIPLMYMPDGVRALLELAMADRAKLTRTIYNIAAMSPRADEIAASVNRAIPDAKFTYKADPVRQGILDSWPKAIDDAAARRDWGWKPTYSLDAMTDDLVPKIRRMLELGAILNTH